MVLDVTDAAQVESRTREAAERMGGLDILVTSAGVSHPGTAWETTLEDWARVLAINLTGSFLCAKAVAPLMIAQGFGRIVMLASISGSQVWSERGLLGVEGRCSRSPGPARWTSQRTASPSTPCRPGPSPPPRPSRCIRRRSARRCGSAIPCTATGRPRKWPT